MLIEQDFTWTIMIKVQLLLFPCLLKFFSFIVFILLYALTCLNHIVLLKSSEMRCEWNVPINHLFLAYFEDFFGLWNMVNPQSYFPVLKNVSHDLVCWGEHFPFISDYLLMNIQFRKLFVLSIQIFIQTSLPHTFHAIILTRQQTQHPFCS